SPMCWSTVSSGSSRSRSGDAPIRELAPGPVPRNVVVPLVRRLPDILHAVLQVLAQQIVVEILDAETRLVGNGDEALLDDRIGQAGGDVVPPGDLDRVVLERQEVFRRHG